MELCRRSPKTQGVAQLDTPDWGILPQPPVDCFEGKIEGPANLECGGSTPLWTKPRPCRSHQATQAQRKRSTEATSFDPITRTSSRHNKAASSRRTPDWLEGTSRRVSLVVLDPCPGPSIRVQRTGRVRPVAPRSRLGRDPAFPSPEALGPNPAFPSPETLV